MLAVMGAGKGLSSELLRFDARAEGESVVGGAVVFAGAGGGGGVDVAADTGAGAGAGADAGTCSANSYLALVCRTSGEAAASKSWMTTAELAAVMSSGDCSTRSSELRE